VRDAQYQRQLRPDDGEIRAESGCERGCGFHIAQVQRQALRIIRNSTVSRRAPDFFYGSGLPQFPYQCVLTTAAAEDQNFHVGSFERIRDDTAARPSLSTGVQLAPASQKCFHLSPCPGTLRSSCFFSLLLCPGLGASEFANCLRCRKRRRSTGSASMLPPWRFSGSPHASLSGE